MSAADGERQRALLRWYGGARRRLPWRNDAPGPHPDPYRVLVSEVMLQQTRVDTVVPAFLRWMTRFPSLLALAAAGEDEVVAAWAGLGYYRRARGLHAAARAVRDRHGGRLPRAAEALAALPGVGPYTVGALRAIAFAEPAAMVDGNVARVLARWHGVEGEVGATRVRKALWALAHDEAFAAEAAADPPAWSQALMELGALVCTPRTPDCGRCPVAAGCVAFARGAQAAIPATRTRPAPQLVSAAALLRLRPGARGPEVWLVQRPPRGRWAGLWQPPMWEGQGAAQALRAGAGGLGEARPIGALTHVLSHRRYEVAAFTLLESSGAAAHADDEALIRAGGGVAARWRAVAEIDARGDGVSRLATRLLALLGSAEAHRAEPDIAP